MTHHIALPGVSLDTRDILVDIFMIASRHNTHGILALETLVATVVAYLVDQSLGDSEAVLTLWLVHERARLSWNEPSLAGPLPPTLLEHFHSRRDLARRMPECSQLYESVYVALRRGASLGLLSPASLMTTRVRRLSIATFHSTGSLAKAHRAIQKRFDRRAGQLMNWGMAETARRATLCYPNYTGHGDCWSTQNLPHPTAPWMYSSSSRAYAPLQPLAPCEWWISQSSGRYLRNQASVPYCARQYLAEFTDVVARIASDEAVEPALVRMLLDGGVPAAVAHGWICNDPKIPECTGQDVCRCHMN